MMFGLIYYRMSKIVSDLGNHHDNCERSASYWIHDSHRLESAGYDAAEARVCSL